MLDVMTDSEVEEQRKRIRHLYMTEWDVDGVTAILMDTNTGGSGLWENTARVKAHAILHWLKFKAEQRRSKNSIDT